MGHFGWLYQDVIARGYRLGVAASGDEHRGRPGGGAPGVQVFGVRGGLTGVLAESLDRRSVGERFAPVIPGRRRESTPHCSFNAANTGKATRSGIAGRPRSITACSAMQAGNTWRPTTIPA